MEVTDMRLQTFRQDLYDAVPLVVMQQVKHSDKPRAELISLIRTFGDFKNYRPWPAFLRAVSGTAR